MTGPVAGVISRVISSASASLDGEMAPTRCGLDNQERKKILDSCDMAVLRDCYQKVVIGPQQRQRQVSCAFAFATDRRDIASLRKRAG
jgi:hypothetical protein